MATKANPQTGLTPAAELAEYRKPLFPGESEEYSKARKKLFAEEIEFRRHLTRLTEQRKALPAGPVIRADYGFKRADGREISLRELFGNHNMLISYFWMYGLERECSCARTGWEVLTETPWTSSNAQRWRLSGAVRWNANSRSRTSEAEST